MGAPLGFKTFATGDVLTAADTNGYLMQGVWTFASAAARDAAVTSPQEGNVCYLKDTDAVMTYSGSAWVAVGITPGSVLVKRASFSNVASTTTTFDSVFTSTYANYLVIIDTLYAATTADDLQFQMRYAAATETGATYYGSSYGSIYNGTQTNQGSNAATYFTVSSSTGSSTYPGSGLIYFNRVGSGSQTPNWNGLYQDMSSSGAAWFFGGQTQAARVYDGFLVKSSSTNITGTISVYGLAK